MSSDEARVPEPEGARPAEGADAATATDADASAAGSRVRQGLKRLASESVIYGIGQAGGRAVQLLLVPVLTRALDPAAYGVAELVVGYLQTMILLLVLGMDSALARFFYQEPDRDAKIRMVSTSFWFRIGLGLACAAPIALFAAPLAHHLIGGDAYRKYLTIGAATLPMTLIVMFGNDVLRVTFQPWKYVTLNLVQTVLGASLALWFVIRMQLGVAGVLYGRFAGDALAALAALVLIRHSLRARFDLHVLRRMLAYGAPLVPSLFCFGIITGFDRYYLQLTRSLTELAVYAVAMKFFTVMIFAASAFQLAYGPFAYARASTPEAPRLYARALGLYMAIATSGALCVGLFAPEALAVLATPAYAAAALPALVLGFAAVAFGAYTVTGVGLGLALKTGWATVAAGVAAVIAVVSQIALTPRYGPLGAAVGTWLGYATATVVVYRIAQRFHPLPYQGMRWLVVFLVANGLAVAGQLVAPVGPAGFTLKLVIAVAFASMALTMAMGRIDAWRRPGAG